MKHLSYILALWVLLLSTVPCFLEDKCLFQCANEQTEEPCADIISIYNRLLLNIL